MDALVCVKATVREPPRVGGAGGLPVFEAVRAGPLVINEGDAYAVDEAVLLKKRHGGRITVVTVGPLAGQEALYSSLARGADAALRVDATLDDPLDVARVLAAVAREGGYDLVLTGMESYEELASAVGPALAAYLGVPFASAVTGIEIADGGGRATVTRELGGGYSQTLDVPLPAVLCVQSGICSLSYPATMRVLQARKQPARSVTLQSLGVDPPEPAARLVTVEPPRGEREAEMIEGDPAEVAAALLDHIEGALPSP